jgi:hypothetical protein
MAECLLHGCGVSKSARRPHPLRSIPDTGRPLTGEPCAGEPHARF